MSTSKREHALSKRMCGVGIMLCGILLLSVALIMGLDFPVYVFDKNRKDLCILNATHRLYNDWLNDTFRDKFNRIYYWELKNPDSFLYGGAFPQVEQRGPYVYREFEQKYQVRYSYNKVQFYLRKWQVFDQRRTKTECGYNCTEDDVITLLNPNYFRLVGKHGDVNYALKHVPVITNSMISEIMNLLSLDYQRVMTLFGQLSSKDLDKLVPDLGFPSSFTNLGFGSWISLQDSPYKRIVIQHRNTADFTYKEMAGLFQIITDKILFGTVEDTTTSTSSSSSSFFADCDLNIQSFKFFPGQDNQQRGTLKYDSKTQACTFRACLSKYMEHQIYSTTVARYLNNVTDCISRFLCISNATACFNLPLNPYVQNAYILTIYEYIHTHLTRYAFYKKIIATKEDIVASKRQSQLALGVTYMNGTNNKGDSSTLSLDMGILEHTARVSDISKKSKFIVLYNCYDLEDAQTNFNWKSYDGEDYIPQHYFPNASLDERKINSYWRNLVPTKHMVACEDSFLEDQDYAFFIPEFWRKMVFSPLQLKYLVDGVSCILQIKRSMFEEVDDKFVENEGLQTMDAVYGYRSWLSLPLFLYAGNTAQAYDMEPREDKHLVQLAVEPVTGILWESDIRYQLNIGILPSYLSVLRPRKIKLNSTNFPIPVYWVDKSFRYNEKGKAEFQDRTKRLLQAACGGLIGMSVIACVTMIMGVLAATVTIRSGRVAPVENPADVGL